MLEQIESFDRDMPIHYLPKREKISLEIESHHGIMKPITFEFSHFRVEQYVQSAAGLYTVIRILRHSARSRDSGKMIRATPSHRVPEHSVGAVGSNGGVDQACFSSRSFTVKSGRGFERPDSLLVENDSDRLPYSAFQSGHLLVDVA